ncbi:MAG: hypothetical protein JRJ39_12730 [Deltaproteobacteria bacterium]|nr:hypothetical protein [Deltaproteobacteria bacterium]
MFSETTKIQRTVMGVTAVIAGIFMMYFAPEQGMQTLKIALENVMERLIPFDPDFYPAVPVLGATYSIWMVVLWLAGAFSIVIAWKVYQGELWARSAMLGFSAIPAVAGMTMLIPWMVLVVSDYSQGPVPGILPPPPGTSVMPPVIWTMVFGLIFYYIFLFADQDSIKNKILKLVPYTFLGIVAGMVFMNGQHGVRYFIFIPELFTENPPSSFNPLGNFFTNLDHYNSIALTTISQVQINAMQPDQMVSIVDKMHNVTPQIVKFSEPTYDPNTLVLLLGGFMNYVSSYLMVLAIPFLAMKNKFGYYTVLGTSLATALIGFQGYIIRSSFEWAVGGFLSLALLGVFLLPVFKNLFIAEEK